MKLLKLAIISFLFFFLLITGISLFIPSSVRISRAAEISAPKEKVMEQIAHAENWKNWYPGADSLQLLMIAGEPKGVIAVNDSMQGLQITEVNDSTVIAINVGRGSKENHTGWKVMAGGSSTSVQWYMDFKLHWYPWEKFASLLFDKQYGTPMEMGLNQLKKKLEN